MPGVSVRCQKLCVALGAQGSRRDLLLRRQLSDCFKNAQGDNFLVNFLRNARHRVAALRVVHGARCVEKLGLQSACASEQGSAAETPAVPSLQLSVPCYSWECAFPRK